MPGGQSNSGKSREIFGWLPMAFGCVIDGTPCATAWRNLLPSIAATFMPDRILPRLARVTLALTLWSPLAHAKPISPPSVAGYVGPVLAAEPVEDGDGRIAEAQFDSTTRPLPLNVPSLGYHASATSEFGDLVHLSGNTHFIDSLTVTMSSWAIRSDYPGSSPLGFTHPITLTLHAVDRSRGEPRPGAVLSTVTTSFLIPWRPEPEIASAPTPLRPWRGPDGLLYSGLAFNVTFDLGALAGSLPDEVIFGVGFNTQHYGVVPLGAPGPYDALHLGISAAAPVGAPDLAPGLVYWKTADGRLYADGGTGGVNTFRPDTGWTHYTPAVRFNNSPYGSLADALGRLEELPGSDAAASGALGEARKLLGSALERTLWNNHRTVRGVWGRLVFDLLAESASTLAPVTGHRDALGSQAEDAVESLLHVATLLAESALGEAIIASGDPTRIARAQHALEASAGESPARAIDELGTVWRESQLSLR